MNSEYIYLPKIKPEDLILNNEETIIVLKFIFNISDHNLIDSLGVTDDLRAFAQGLLIRAIDLSYSVGFVEAIFRR